MSDRYARGTSTNGERLLTRVEGKKRSYSRQGLNAAHGKNNPDQVVCKASQSLSVTLLHPLNCRRGPTGEVYPILVLV